jgi:hypothetical protein
MTLFGTIKSSSGVAWHDVACETCTEENWKNPSSHLIVHSCLVSRIKEIPALVVLEVAGQSWVPTHKSMQFDCWDLACRSRRWETQRQDAVVTVAVVVDNVLEVELGNRPAVVVDRRLEAVHNVGEDVVVHTQQQQQQQQQQQVVAVGTREVTVAEVDHTQEVVLQTQEVTVEEVDHHTQEVVVHSRQKDQVVEVAT